MSVSSLQQTKWIGEKNAKWKLQFGEFWLIETISNWAGIFQENSKWAQHTEKIVVWKTVEDERLKLIEEKAGNSVDKPTVMEFRRSNREEILNRETGLFEF